MMCVNVARYFGNTNISVTFHDPDALINFPVLTFEQKNRFHQKLSLQS